MPFCDLPFHVFADIFHDTVWIYTCKGPNWLPYFTVFFFPGAVWFTNQKPRCFPNWRKPCPTSWRLRIPLVDFHDKFQRQFRQWEINTPSAHAGTLPEGVLWCFLSIYAKVSLQWMLRWFRWYNGDWGRYEFLSFISITRSIVIEWLAQWSS